MDNADRWRERFRKLLWPLAEKHNISIKGIVHDDICIFGDFSDVNNFITELDEVQQKEESKG